MSETALTWLVSRGGAVIRDFQASTGLDRVQVSAQEKEVILLGTGDAVKAGSRYLFERGVEKELPMSPVQIQYLTLTLTLTLIEGAPDEPGPDPVPPQR